MPHPALLFSLVLSCVLLVSGRPAKAWDELGHTLICKIAYRAMSNDARAKLNEVIDAQNLGDEHGETLYPSYNDAC